MIMQSRHFLNCFLDNHRRKVSPTNLIPFGNSSSKIGRYHENRLEVYWSTITNLIVGKLFPQANIQKREYNV